MCVKLSKSNESIKVLESTRGEPRAECRSARSRVVCVEQLGYAYGGEAVMSYGGNLRNT